ncbi:MAG: hypothetical protein ACLFQP_10715 [Halothece sp.]
MRTEREKFGSVLVFMSEEESNEVAISNPSEAIAIGTCVVAKVRPEMTVTKIFLKLPDFITFFQWWDVRGNGTLAQSV